MPIPISSTGVDGQLAVFSSAYLGSVRYYAAMLSVHGKVVIDTEESIGKNSWMHNHCRIVGANGVQTLAVPVEHVGNRHGGEILMRDLRISEHGDWRRVHWGALFSAYGKTPFFEYAEDDLKAVYDRHDKWLVDFNMALHEVVVDFLDLPVASVAAPVAGVPTSDWRGLIGGKKPDNVEFVADVPYYNIWASRHGHVSGLSIIDLLMNCGRESLFVLLDMLKTGHDKEYSD